MPTERRHPLRNSTALVVALSLVVPVPHPVRAQDLPACAAGGAVPCAAPDGTTVETPEGLIELLLAPPEAVPDAQPELAPVPETPPEPAPDVTPAPEAVPEAEPAPEPEAAPDPAPETVPAPEVVPEVAPEPVPQAATEAEVEPAPVTAPEAEAAPEPVPEAATAPEPEATSEPVPEPLPEPEVAPAPEAESAPASAPEPEAAPAPEAQPEAAPEVTPEAGTAPGAVTDAVPDPAPEAAIPPQPEPVLVEAPPDTAAAAAADGMAPPAAAVVEETITNDTARAATEDFATTVSGRDRSGNDGDNDELSDFEKALIVGLGAVAVGAILNNGNRVVANSGDRVVVQDDRGALTVLKDEDAILRQPGAQVRTETFADGSSRSFVTRADGSRIETIRAADGRVLRRARLLPDGSEVLLFDDTVAEDRIDVSRLPAPVPALTLQEIDTRDADALARALGRLRLEDALRADASRFSLRQVREVRQVRELAPEIAVDLTFATGSAAIPPEQAGRLLALGQAMAQLVAANPREVFLVEGHTDATGAAEFNLALSDRRAESVALALTQFFGVPPENMVVQGYGESALLVPTLAAEETNRRATVRRITPLLREVVASR